MCAFIKKLLNKLRKKKSTVNVNTVPEVVVPVLEDHPTFEDNFKTLDKSKWIVSSWEAPGNSPVNLGEFYVSNVSIVDEMLCLKLTQTKLADGKFKSVGGEIATIIKFGYGVYEFEVKASSDSPYPYEAGNPVSGSITGCFNYAKDSITEIDVEVEGNERHPVVQFTTWQLASKPNEHTTMTPTIKPHAGFHKYKFIWTPTEISYFVDGVLVSKHNKVIPQEEAVFMFNHWGTNSVNWGGLATVGTRYMYVKNFKYTKFAK